MALAGKVAGKDVGMWFGPSAVALRMLVDAFPACGLGVSVTTDGTLYQTEAFVASPSPAPSASSAASVLSHGHGSTSPHGRGSSSGHAKSKESKRWETGRPEAAYARGGSTSLESGFASGGSMSPELVYGRGGSMSPDFAHGHAHGQGHSPMAEDELVIVRPLSCSRPSTDSYSHERNVGAGTAHPAGGPMSAAEEAYFGRAHSGAEMRTFHCEPVCKMPLSGLDPSMLTGFVVRDEAEWVDLKRRVKELPRTIFGTQDEPPTWPGADDDNDMGLESLERVPCTVLKRLARPLQRRLDLPFAPRVEFHDPLDVEVHMEEGPVTPITPLPTNTRFDLTPQQSAVAGKGRGGKEKTVGEPCAEEGNGEDGFVDVGGRGGEDDWVDPVALPPPIAKKTLSKEKGASSSGKDKSGSKEKSGSGSGKGKKKAVSVPSVHYPFPVSAEDGAGTGAVTPQRERRGSRSAI
ncbi:hypothetical protein K438DRAFT_1791569 [Mycena galopus ATCC 62051]|nr:hypothetical protein K438DRAFT_1791569 [Mycena galopus ATCC 62051]